jgi:phosphatidylglycerophosphate synthase
MAKMLEKYENPINSFTINYICEPISDYIYKYKITPNMITTIGFISALVGSYYLYNYNFYYFAGLYVFSYICDTLDGYIARKYNQGSKFGVYYDHITDILKFIIIFIILFKRYNFINFKYMMLIHIIIVILYVIALGCQEQLLKKKSTDLIFMKSSKKFCNNETKSNIRFLRLFGDGTIIFWILFLIYYLWKYKV